MWAEEEGGCGCSCAWMAMDADGDAGVACEGGMGRVARGMKTGLGNFTSQFESLRRGGGSLSYERVGVWSLHIGWGKILDGSPVIDSALKEGTGTGCLVTCNQWSYGTASIKSIPLSRASLVVRNDRFVELRAAPGTISFPLTGNEGGRQQRELPWVLRRLVTFLGIMWINLEESYLRCCMHSQMNAVLCKWITNDQRS